MLLSDSAATDILDTKLQPYIKYRARLVMREA